MNDPLHITIAPRIPDDDILYPKYDSLYIPYVCLVHDKDDDVQHAPASHRMPHDAAVQCPLNTHTESRAPQNIISDIGLPPKNMYQVPCLSCFRGLRQKSGYGLRVFPAITGDVQETSPLGPKCLPKSIDSFVFLLNI